MKHLRYRGSFLSIDRVSWRVELWQESGDESFVVKDLTFDADQPLVISWGDKAKEEVVCGAEATLKVISPTDRAFADLYSIEPGRVRMDVYRDNNLYWSGCLDTEVYEEPYEALNGYTVTLSFSDFGILKRQRYTRTRLQSVENTLRYCLSRSNISYVRIDQSLISAKISVNAATPLSLAALQINSANFYDEDGEPSTLYDVIEGILQPLSLRMIQREGSVYIYDLNGLYGKAQPRIIDWSGNSQTLGVDRVYNNVRVTWSPYQQSGGLLPETCWLADMETPRNMVALNSLDGKTSGQMQYFSYHYSTDLRDWADATDSGFTLWTSAQGENITINDNRLRYFRIIPQYDGGEDEGIAVQFKSVKGYKESTAGGYQMQFQQKAFGAPANTLAGFLNKIGGLLFTTKEAWLPPVDDNAGLMLRIRLDMLMDPRFNPFEGAENLSDDARQKEWYEQWQSRGNFMYVPVLIKYRPDATGTIYVWDNRDIVQRAVENPTKALPQTLGKWVPYTTSSADNQPNNWAWLAYYDAKDRKETSGVLGWKSNRPAINPHTAGTASILAEAEPGQYLPYPTMGAGKIWIEVCGGTWQLADGGNTLTNVNYNNPLNLWNKISWLLFRLPQIEIVNNTQYDISIDTSDVEYNAELNAGAEEELTIDTICGTSAEDVPTARGAYYNTDSGKPIKALWRAGRMAQAEELLIGTLYSQYATRHTKLSGEAVTSSGLYVYTEDNQPGKRFIQTEDVQDIRLNCSDSTFVELSPDNYDKQL